MKKLFIDYHPKRVCVAMTENNELKEYYAEKASRPKIVGNIYKGRVVNTLQGMKAAFVNIGLEKNAFLYAGETLVDKNSLGEGALKMPQKLNVSPGDCIMCQVVKDYFGTKGVRISQNISLPGRLLVIMPQTDYVGISHKISDEKRREELLNLVRENCPEGVGFIVRTAAQNAANEDIIKEMAKLVSKWKNILESFKSARDGDVVYEEGDLIFRTIRDILDADIEKIVVNSPFIARDLKEKLTELYGEREVVELYTGTESLFTYYNLQPQISKLVKRKVTLKNGAYIVIDKTEALTAIDVNTGKYVGENDLEKTFLNTNYLAAEEIAKQLRLRNIGGIIVVDFIDMELAESRKKLLDAFEKELKKDRVRTSKPVMTTLGLVELTRKKTRSSIYDLLLEECPYCQGDGYVFSEEYVIMRIREAVMNLISDEDPMSVIVTVNPDVFNKLFTLRYLERECLTIWKGKRIYIIPDPLTHREKFSVTTSNEKVLTLPENAKLLY